MTTGEFRKRILLVAIAVAAWCGVAMAEVVSFKDAAKIKSWDAWNDHKKPVPPKERPCVTWAKLNKLDPGLKEIGRLAVRGAKDIRSSKWSVGPVRVSASSGMTPMNGDNSTPRTGVATADRDCFFAELPPPPSAPDATPFSKFWTTHDDLLWPFGTGVRQAANQIDRAAKMKAYVRSALANPQIVGVHWHQFSDQATSGRFDGEYLQVGWTDICDTPYPEAVAALRELGVSLYGSRSKVATAEGGQGNE